MKKLFIVAVIFSIFVALILFFAHISTEKKQDKQDEIIDPPRTNISARASYLNMVISVNNNVKGPLEEMILAAEKDGMCLVVLSGHRTLEQQQEIYDKAKDKSIVALPGTSEHEQGIAVDLGGCPMINGARNDVGERLELKNDFDKLPEYKWLLEHASEYGFVQSYAEGGDSESGFPAEQWHWKFVTAASGE